MLQLRGVSPTPYHHAYLWVSGVVLTHSSRVPGPILSSGYSPCRVRHVHLLCLCASSMFSHISETCMLDWELHTCEWSCVWWPRIAALYVDNTSLLKSWNKQQFLLEIKFLDTVHDITPISTHPSIHYLYRLSIMETSQSQSIMGSVHITQHKDIQNLYRCLWDKVFCKHLSFVHLNCFPSVRTERTGSSEMARFHWQCMKWHKNAEQIRLNKSPKSRLICVKVWRLAVGLSIACTLYLLSFNPVILQHGSITDDAFVIDGGGASWRKLFLPTLLSFLTVSCWVGPSFI